MNGLASKFLELTDRRVDVWCVRIAASIATAATFETILARDEMARADCLRFKDLRRLFIVSRAVLRTLVGKYLGSAPEDIRFKYGASGRPSVAGEVNLDFNVSHSGTLALFAFTLNGKVGVDVEQIRALGDIDDIAGRFFCAEEAAELKSVSSADRVRAFFSCWTRKEAYLKALGQGLGAPLDDFCVTLRPDAPARFLYIANEVSHGWTLHNIEPAPHYAGALAYHDVPRQIRVLHDVEAADLLRLIPG